MKGNYIALNVHLIWTTKNKYPFLKAKFRYPLLEYIRRIALDHSISIKIVNGVEDHVHCLVSLHPTQNISHVVKTLKGETSRWLNQQEWFDKNFEWQDGYGAISVSPQHYQRTRHYIYNQEAHHAFNSLDDELKVFEEFSNQED
ncbi:IS200/IS605 family transposase [Emticicia fluvialis]|uniref:IS200/IS605 family transposase n=1 Tax=Emticicia fluvialis TaxID=2974474 RepID=UPI0021663263|nr:IS200/IS605 family transposase [Emticicia fluvialis]